MTSRATSRPSGRPVVDAGRPTVGYTLGQWFALGPSLLWRVPLLLVMVALTAWFAFRGLVHLAFLFVEHPIGTFLFAPALLPFAALPAICFLVVIRVLPRVWLDPSIGAGRKALAVAGGPLAALLVAQFLDLVQINALKLMGIALPRLPLDPY
jgi:hypothetical protein